MSCKLVKITPILADDIGDPVWYDIRSIISIDAFSEHDDGHSRLTLVDNALYIGCSTDSSDGFLYCVETADEIAYMINHNCSLKTARILISQKE